MAISPQTDPQVTAAYDDPNVTTSSGITLPVVASAADIRDGLEERLGEPGRDPFTRGAYPRMYRQRPWTIRQLAGFGTAADTNKRYRLLLERGSTGINGVFDYPSLRAFGSDDPLAAADVGRGGVAVDVRDDFVDLFDSIALDELSVSLVSSQPIGAVAHLAMFIWAARQRGFDPAALSGTSQNDFLMETAITIAPRALPPAGSFRLECDVAEFCAAEMPRWHPVSVSGYNYREAGADAQLELALVISHGQAVVDELLRRGVEAERFLPRLSFFLCAHNDLLEEVAKFRAARRMWARWVRDVLHIRDPRCQRFRFHVQTSGATNVARFALTNIARGALQGLAAVLGGAQSLHINGYDEAIAIPTEGAALTALRTQYVLLEETGVAGSVDPLGGSYLIEYLTDAIEARASETVADIEDMAGIVGATESGWVHRELARLAFDYQRSIDAGARKIVGINCQAEGDDQVPPPFELPADALERQQARIKAARARRNDQAVSRALQQLAADCRTGQNVMRSALAAVEADASIGEFGRVFREVLGEWQFPLW
jgi:methylmalonyl-CoA mutase N-terminal domain/subunit